MVPAMASPLISVTVADPPVRPPRFTLRRCDSAGSGKTRIAQELIHFLKPQLRADGRLSVFLAPTIPLVQQVRHPPSLQGRAR